MKRNTTISRSALARTVVVSRLRSLAEKSLFLFLALLLVWSGPAHAQTAPTFNSMIVADFNHDGIPDVLTPSATALNFTISFGAAPYGTFSSNAVLVPYPATCVASPAPKIAVADFNGDGIPDLALTCAGGQPYAISLYIMLGNGDGTFRTLSQQYGLTNVLVGDFNKDGKMDVIVQGSQDGLQRLGFYPGNGDGTLGTASAERLPSTVYTTGIALDMNLDGYPDLVFGNFAADGTNSVDVFQNNQDGTFGTSAPASGTYIPTASSQLQTTGTSNDTTILAGNFYGRGVADVAIVDTGSVPGVFLPQYAGSGNTISFTGPAAKSTFTGLTGAAAGSIVSAYSDLLISNGTTLTVYGNNGSGSFSANYSGLSVASTASLFAAADANGDGHADIYTGATTSTGVSLTVNLVSGSATATSSAFSLPAGTTPVTANWPGNINFSGSTATGSQIVNAIPTTTTLASSLNPSVVGQSVMFIATVSPSAAVGKVPSGMVSFMDGATVLGTGTVGGTGIATLTTSTLTVATHTISVVYSGDSIFAGSSSGPLAQVVNSNLPTLTWSNPAPIAYGIPLGAAQLNATATGITGATLPGTFVYTPPAGTILTPGVHTLSVTFNPTDSVDYISVSTTVQITVTDIVLTSFTPNTATIGAPNTTITITGSGFVATTVAQINGTAIATTLVNPTTLTAIVPTADFATPATLLVTLKNPTTGSVTASLPLVVSAPPVAATYNGPTSTTPGSQPTLNLVIPAYPVALTATLSLNVTATLSSGVTDPNTLFSNGTTSFSFIIPAGTTNIPTIQVQAGTVAETITVPLVLTVNGVNVTPNGLAPVVIHVLPAVPAATSATLTRSGDVLTVTIDGYSNTREIVQANFHFVAVAGTDISTPDFTAPVGTVFATYYAGTGSVPYGSSFVYVQTFNVSGDTNNIASVQVTLTNTQGVSTTYTAQ